jgi:WD40 repeat protein
LFSLDAVNRLTGDLKDIYDLAWSPDGKHILSGSLDQTAKIWDTITGPSPSSSSLDSSLTEYSQAT